MKRQTEKVGGGESKVGRGKAASPLTGSIVRDDDLITPLGDRLFAEAQALRSAPRPAARSRSGLPVFEVSEKARPFTPETVRKALDDDA